MHQSSPRSSLSLLHVSQQSLRLFLVRFPLVSVNRGLMCFTIKLQCCLISPKDLFTESFWFLQQFPVFFLFFLLNIYYFHQFVSNVSLLCCADTKNVMFLPCVLKFYVSKRSNSLFISETHGRYCVLGLFGSLRSVSDTCDY